MRLQNYNNTVSSQRIHSSGEGSNMAFEPMPTSGVTQTEIENTFEHLRAGDKDGRSSFSERWLNDRGLLLDDGALEVAKAACKTFFTKNNSHSPIMTLERELVSWVLNLFQAERDAAGGLTSGGSESLFLATAAAFKKVSGCQNQ